MKFNLDGSTSSDPGNNQAFASYSILQMRSVKIPYILQLSQICSSAGKQCRKQALNSIDNTPEIN